MAPRFLVDVSPLRESRQFRLLFAGQLVSTLGSQLTVVAIPYQVYRQTHSSLQVGAVSLAQLVPLIVGALVGGSVGDAVDRRSLLLVTSVALSLTSVGLALNAAAAHPSVAAVYAVSALAAALNGFVSTARNAVVPSLVRPELLLAANSFMQILFQVGVVVGPAVAGNLIGPVGLPWVYGIDAVTYSASVVTVLRMAPLPPAEGATRAGWRSFTEGLAYLRGRQALQGVYLIDVNAMVFGMPRALFPALADHVFRSVASLGYMTSAVGVGGLLGGMTTGWVDRIAHQGRLITGAVVVWGAAIAAFGLSRVLAVSLVLLALGGWADVISAVVRNTVLQASVPDRFRSRMSSIQMAVVQGGPRLGDLESGAVAAAAGTELAIVSGGLACIAGAAVLVGLLPGFRRYAVPVTGAGAAQLHETAHRAAASEVPGELEGGPPALGPAAGEGPAGPRP